MNTDDRAARIGLALALLAFSWAVFASAWLSDDAWITFRSIDNLLAGHGLRWNPAERVQTFTHPAWALLLSAVVALSGEFPLTAFAVSLVCTAGAVAVLVRSIALTPLLAAVGVTALLASKAFVDYSTSGLENPLTHFLLAGFLAFWFWNARDTASERRLLALTLVAALFALTRPDLVLLIAPALAAAAHACGRRAWRALVLGALPFLAWEAFALVYYGFPVPNTAYAKLATGIPRFDLAEQGARYLQDSAVRDPATLLVVLGGGGLAAWRVPRARPLVLGVALYLVYVVRVGGDADVGALRTQRRSHRRRAAGRELLRLAASAGDGHRLRSGLGTGPGPPRHRRRTSRLLPGHRAVAHVERGREPSATSLGGDRHTRPAPTRPRAARRAGRLLRVRRRPRKNHRRRVRPRRSAARTAGRSSERGLAHRALSAPRASGIPRNPGDGSQSHRRRWARTTVGRSGAGHPRPALHDAALARDLAAQHDGSAGSERGRHQRAIDREQGIGASLRRQHLLEIDSRFCT
jgi:hypothetical protein